MNPGVPQLFHKCSVQPLEDQIGQRHAKDPLAPIKPGKHSAEKQKGRHMKGVDYSIQRLFVGKFPRNLQQVPQHHQGNEQKAQIIILIFPCFHVRRAFFPRQPMPA